MSSLQSVMRCASAVRRKRQRSSRLRPIFPGRVGVSIGRDAKPSDQRRANGSHLESPGVGKFEGGGVASTFVRSNAFAADIEVPKKVMLLHNPTAGASHPNAEALLERHP